MQRHQLVHIRKQSAPHSRQITTTTPHQSIFYRPDALPDAQPTVSKHWRQPKAQTDNPKHNSSGPIYCMDRVINILDTTMIRKTLVNVHNVLLLPYTNSTVWLTGKTANHVVTRSKSDSCPLIFLIYLPGSMHSVRGNCHVQTTSVYTSWFSNCNLQLK